MSIENVICLIEQAQTLNTNKPKVEEFVKINEWLKTKPNLKKIIAQDIKDMNYAFNQYK
jgi:hypothetical protein